MYGMKPYLITAQKLKPCAYCGQRGWVLKRFSDNYPSICNACHGGGFVNDGDSETHEWFGRTFESAKKKAQKHYAKFFGNLPYGLNY